MTTTRDGLAALRAAKLAFERAGNKMLANSCREWISEVEDEIKAEDRAEVYDKITYKEDVH